MLAKAMLMAGTIMVSSAVVLPAYADSMKTDDAIEHDATEMKQDAQNKYEEAKDFTYDKKSEFMEWAQKQSDALGEQYDEMKESASDKGDSTWDAVKDAWNDAKENLSAAMDDVQESSAETWEDVKAETVDALNEAQKALDDKPDAQ